MLKNTYYVILFLAVLAALVIGLNIGKKIQLIQNNQVKTQTSELEKSPTGTSIELETIDRTSSLSAANTSGSQSGFIKIATQSGGTGKATLYTSSSCGVSLTYPDTIAVEKSSTEAKGAVFTNRSNPTDMVVLTCQKDIPKPPLAAENIENTLIGTIPGKLYHDTSQKDGTKIDALIFTHPKTQLDVFIGGYGATFNTIIQSLKVL